MFTYTKTRTIAADGLSLLTTKPAKSFARTSRIVAARSTRPVVSHRHATPRFVTAEAHLVTGHTVRHAIGSRHPSRMQGAPVQLAQPTGAGPAGIFISVVTNGVSG
jgi:hypothetical protein